LSAPEGDLPSGLLPVIDASTEIVILGSFPSVASLAEGQYYAHPQNQFWRLVGAVLDEPLPSLPYSLRCKRLLANRIGLWDVIARCARKGSLDSAIRSAELNDFASLRRSAPRLAVLVFNGQSAARHAAGRLPAGLALRQAPSSSPAHAAQGFEAKRVMWAKALERSVDGSL